MILIELSEQDKDKYNRFVAENETGSFLQSWEWGEWQASLGRAVYRFKITDERGGWAGVLQLIKMPLFGKRFYLYAPYGPVSDFRFQISDLSFVLQDLENKFPEAVFLRIEPKVGPSLNFNLKSLIKTANIQPAKTLVLDLAKTEEELLAAMHHKTRYNIRLAQKHNVQITSELLVVPGHGLYLGEALDLIVETAKRQKFKTFAPSYYQKMLDFFGTRNNHSELKVYVYKALHERRLLAAAMIVDFGGTRTYLFGGSSEIQKNLMAPYLLHFQAVKDAKMAGLKFYDFWGVETSSGKSPGFVRFKQGFGGSVKEYPGAYDYVCHPLTYLVYKRLRQVNRWLSR